MHIEVVKDPAPRRILERADRAIYLGELSDSFKTLGRVVQMIRRTRDRSDRVVSGRCGSHFEEERAEKCRL
jgi:hypothetical protein